MLLRKKKQQQQQIHLNIISSNFICKNKTKDDKKIQTKKNTFFLTRRSKMQFKMEKYQFSFHSLLFRLNLIITINMDLIYYRFL